jgi:hypothetical protein
MVKVLQWIGTTSIIQLSASYSTNKFQKKKNQTKDYFLYLLVEINIVFILITWACCQFYTPVNAIHL